MFRPVSIQGWPLVAGALLLAGTAPAGAQNVTLDEGTFVVYLDGREAGTETFSIRRMGSGTDAKVLANAVVDLGTTEMRPVLETGADMAPVLYQNKIAGGEDTEVAVSAAGRRFVARIRSAAGERERELRAQQGAVFLDNNVAHQYYFLSEVVDRQGAVVPVVVPRTGEQVSLTVAEVGTETLSIGGQQVPARRVRLEGGGQEHTVWFDAQGRVLRVLIPATRYRAERQSV